MIATSDQDATLDVMAKFKTPMGMPISKTTKVVTNFKTPEVMAKFNAEVMTNGVKHFLITCFAIMSPPPNVHVGEDFHFNELEDLGSLDPILDKENMHFYKFFQCTFPLVIASDSKNIPNITKLAKVAKPSLVPTSVFRLPREVNGFFFMHQM